MQDMRRVSLALGFWLAACGSPPSSPDGGSPVSGDGGLGGADAGQLGDAGVVAPSCSNLTGDRATQVCLRWKCERASRSEGTWSGAVASCSEGDISAEGRANALRMLNLYRFLAQLPEVTTDPTRDAKAQQCALMMRANNSLSHQPPSNWACYSAEGAEAAGRSNISSGPGVRSVDLYMLDSGNATTLGHRRWILSNQLGPVGLGSTDKHSCMWVIQGSGNANQPWMAWPPPGPVPLEAIAVPGMGSLDSTGWSVQSNAINLNGAQVTVQEGGNTLPVTVTTLLNNYGSTWAVRFVPSGWTTQAGKTYSVSVTGIATPIQYQVEVLGCL